MSRFRISTAPYKKLFQVKAWHGYYREGICPDLVFQPSEATLREFRNCQLVFKSAPEGFVVFYHADRTPPILRVPGFRPPKLTFFIRHQNPRFLHFSDLPMPEDSEDAFPFYANERGYRLSNQMAHPGPEGELLLHSGDFLGAGSDRPYLVPERFTLPFPKDIPYNKLHLTDAWGKPVELPPLPALAGSEDPNALPQGNHYLKLDTLSPGRYQLDRPGGKAFDFYVLPEQEVPAFGVIDIYLGESPDKGGILDKKGEINPQDYRLQIAPRATYWKYLLLNQRPEEVTFSDPEISPMKLRDKGNGKKIRFKGPETVTLRNGRQALQMVSETPIPLQEIAQHIFELTLKMNGRRIRSPIKLPVPGTNLILPTGKDPHTFCSDMYVYL
ncbi:MAG: hypothetical protein D6722_14665 [Bacteroidetes bacterium]|nr:MAG: hypothetical protein D6722_14665 [Bacteroidota bacterium]